MYIRDNYIKPSTEQNNFAISTLVPTASKGLSLSGWVREPTEAETNPTIKAINTFDTSERKYLKVKTTNDKTQLEITSTGDIPSMLFRKVNNYCINSTSLNSTIGSIFRNIDDYLGEDNTSLIMVAKFLKTHEDEISKSKLFIDPFQKKILKQKLINLENKYDIQFSFIDKLFGKRTGTHIHHQSKMRDIIDQSCITESDISLFNLTEDGIYLSEKTDAEIQQSIGKIFQNCILPIYKTPMPKIATVMGDEKNFIRKQIYNDGRIIDHKTVRCWHDSMHAGRVAFWTQVLGRDSVLNRILAAAGGGFHDSAREHEGTDHWDKESSLLFDHFLTNMNMTPKEREIHVFPLAEKDPRDGQFTSDEQRVLHDSDCIDIIRVVREDFNPNFLCSSKFEDSTFDKKQFLKEAADFIAYTEDQELKYLFENESTDFYGDLIRLLFKLEEQQPGRFEIIISLIGTSMECYRETMDKSFISKVIDLCKTG